MNNLKDEERLLREMGEVEGLRAQVDEVDSKRSLWEEFLETGGDSDQKKRAIHLGELIQEDSKGVPVDGIKSVAHEHEGMLSELPDDEKDHDNSSFEALGEEFRRELVEEALRRIKAAPTEKVVHDAESFISLNAQVQDENIVELRQERSRGKRGANWIVAALTVAASVLIFWLISDRVTPMLTESDGDGYASLREISYQLELPDSLSETRSMGDNSGTVQGDNIERRPSKSSIRRDANNVEWILRPTRDVSPEDAKLIELALYKRSIAAHGQAQQSWQRIPLSRGGETPQYQVSNVGSIRVQLDPENTFDRTRDEWELLFVVGRGRDFPAELNSMEELLENPDDHQLLTTRVLLQER